MADDQHLSAETRDRWKHRPGDLYVLIVGSAVGNHTVGFRIEHTAHPRRFTTLTEARSVGLRELDRSDDFNIGVVRGRRLVAITWMGEIVDDDPGLMSEIAAEVGLPHYFDGTVGSPVTGAERGD